MVYLSLGCEQVPVKVAFFLIANRCGIHVRNINTYLSNVPGERLFGCDFGSIMKGHALDRQHKCHIHAVDTPIDSRAFELCSFIVFTNSGRL